MNYLSLPRWSLVAVAAIALAACGSSSSDDLTSSVPTKTTDVPQSALSTVAGLIDYMKTLLASSSETSEPLLVGDAMLPKDETIEPAN